MKKTIMALSLLSLLSSTAFATERLDDVDTLQVAIRTVWPPELSTSKQAITWLVEPLGYQLTTEYPAPKDANALLNIPIPMAAKLHRTMPVLDAIQLLIGTDNTILLDKKHRLISVARGH